VQKVNHVTISCLEILDNRELKKGGKYVSILCLSRGEGSFNYTGSAVLFPSGKKLTVRKTEVTESGEYIAVLKGIHRSDLKKRCLIVPSPAAVSEGKDAFFLIPKKGKRFEKGSFFVSGGIFPEYNRENNRVSTSISFTGSIAYARFFYPFPLVVGARYFIAAEENRDLLTPVTLAYPGKLPRKESLILADRLMKFGGRPSLKALYSIILRMDKMVNLPDYMKENEFDGSIPSGSWVFMSREYERIKNAVLKRTSKFGGVHESELYNEIRGPYEAVHQILEQLKDEGVLLSREGFLINGIREAGKSLSPMAAKLLEDLRNEEQGVNLSLISNPLLKNTYLSLGRMDLIKILQEEVVFHPECFEKLKNLVLEGLKTGNELTLSDLKEKTTLSRRLLIPLLEELDSEGYFERNGESRIVLEKK